MKGARFDHPVLWFRPELGTALDSKGRAFVAPSIKQSEFCSHPVGKFLAEVSGRQGIWKQRAAGTRKAEAQKLSLSDKRHQRHGVGSALRHDL